MYLQMKRTKRIRIDPRNQDLREKMINLSLWYHVKNIGREWLYYIEWMKNTTISPIYRFMLWLHKEKINIRRKINISKYFRDKYKIYKIYANIVIWELNKLHGNYLKQHFQVYLQNRHFNFIVWNIHVPCSSF